MHLHNKNAVMLCLLCLIGCSVGPEYQRPATVNDDKIQMFNYGIDQKDVL